MFGLYDPDGILRLTAADKEACLAYAELFDLPSGGCSLMSLPDQEENSFKYQRPHRHQEGSSN